MTAIQTRSLILAIGIHVLIAILFMFIYFTTPNPPFAEGLAGGGGGGSIVEFGTLDISEANTPPPPPEVVKDDEIMTSDIEETVAINQPEKTNKQPEKKPEVKVKPKETVELAKVPERKPDERALYTPGKKGQRGNPNGTGAGNGTGGQGTGDGGGNGSGTGPGSGSGSGNGNGSGHGDGNGIGFDLTGRSMNSRPHVDDRSQDEGTVVITIIVDKTGKVTSAEGPGRGSTTTNSNLVRKAKEAAKQAHFSASPNGVEEQRGTMTFNFSLR